MVFLIVLLLLTVGGLTPGQCGSEPSADINGFQFELLLTHMEELEARMEEHLNAGLKVLERNVIEACTEKMQQIVSSQTRQLEYIVNQPAIYREGGWFTIQHRFDGSVNFFRNWTEYRNGFGAVRGEFWLGLEKLHQRLRTGTHELLVVLEDFDGSVAYAHYGDFRVGSEGTKYALQKLGEYTGTAGDSLRLHEHKPFSTYDARNGDLSGWNCATEHEGAWWFKTNGECIFSHLNGKYSKKPLVAYEMGVHWHDFRGDRYSLKSTKMMIRRSN
ncbi:angiopoietin-related protein 6-like [Anopheles ziemanni]|uniref:angiopoietin-related protein 6-like n=1 Tax=Anopheles coustani TaxID=139045 RepID=UPI0026591BB4|nr:angiopoietin-related protein 6-like [Anopheles coustani]XP_058178435.1 angiopoietin-related protein 6-like [Anopheles ziemanni]